MPPRYVYWTILAGGLPTAFRAGTQEELLPTFKRIHDKHPDAVMKYFARGQLWDSPEEARRPVEPPAGRGSTWRPGGTHRDPRQPFIDSKKARNLDRRRQRFERKNHDSTGPPGRGFDTRGPKTGGAPSGRSFGKGSWSPRPPGQNTRPPKDGDGPPRRSFGSGRDGAKGFGKSSWSPRPPGQNTRPPKTGGGPSGRGFDTRAPKTGDGPLKRGFGGGRDGAKGFGKSSWSPRPPGQNTRPKGPGSWPRRDNPKPGAGGSHGGGASRGRPPRGGDPRRRRS